MIMIDEEQLQQEILDFVKQQQTLMLSTVNAENQPLASYTPFIQDEQGNFYIFISDMAEHSKNIQMASQNKSGVSVLLIEDEQASRNLFARKRLSYSCQVKKIDRSEAEWAILIQQFQDRFGKIMELLAQLGDFRLFCLRPKIGNFVQGFGKAYNLENGKIKHITK